MQKGALYLALTEHEWTRPTCDIIQFEEDFPCLQKGVEADEEIHHINYTYSVNSLPYLSQNLNQFILLYDDHSSRQGPLFLFLNLVLLNKLGCHTHFSFSANQITWSRLLIQILNGKQCRSRSVGFFRSQLIWVSEANWSGSTLFAKAWHIHVSAGLGITRQYWYFSHFPQKHMLWVIIRIASLMCF